MAEQHFTTSSYLEKIIEHKFISEILSSLWLHNVFNAEVAGFTFQVQGLSFQGMPRQAFCSRGIYEVLS